MLTRRHRDSLTRDGYVVLPGLVPDRLLRAARDVICSFIGADLDRPATWYQHEPLAWSVVPHQGGRNRGVRPRVSLAVSMHPEGTDADRQERIECWKRKRAPAWWRGWKGQIDPESVNP